MHGILQRALRLCHPLRILPRPHRPVISRAGDTWGRMAGSLSAQAGQQPRLPWRLLAPLAPTRFLSADLQCIRTRQGQHDQVQVHTVCMIDDLDPKRAASTQV